MLLFQGKLNWVTRFFYQNVEIEVVLLTLARFFIDSQDGNKDLNSFDNHYNVLINNPLVFLKLQL